MKKIVLVLFIAMAISAIGHNVRAEDETKVENPALNRLAVLDIDQIMVKCDAAVDIREKLEKKKDVYQKQMTEKESKLRDQVKELTKQKETLSDEEFAKKREDFEKSVIEAQREVQERIKKLEKSYDEAMAKLRDEVVKIVAEYSTQQKLGMVLARGQVVLVDSDLDITEVIMKKVNAKVKKVEVNLPN